MKKERLFVNGFMRLAACALVALVGVGDVWGQSATSAPINPAFLQWQKERKQKSAQPNAQTNSVTKGLRLLSASGGDEELGLGLVPEIFDTSYLAILNTGMDQGIQDAMASSYDLRSKGVLTPVRDQGSYGTCWAHATYASLESGLLSEGKGMYDFSENNLANLHGFDGDRFHDFEEGGIGGTALITSAYLLRWGGPVLEDQDPYPNYGCSKSISPVRHVQNVRWIAGRTYYLDLDAIKKAVVEHGALHVSYCHNFSTSYYNSKTSAYYFNGNTSRKTNHAVALVGWDDNYSSSNFSQKPAGNGAFIVRNSWGSSWGDGGYFYVSYYDESFAWKTLYAFSNTEGTDNYDAVYQYDPLGQVSAIGYKSTVSWGANIFTATESSQLAAVGFYALTPNTSYTIYIYTGCSTGAPTSGTLAVTQSGRTDAAGFFTIPLTTKAALSALQRFSVVLKLTTPGYNYPLAYEYAYSGYSSEATASSGQSFLSSNGSSWKDFTDVHGSANFCCKAYTQSATVVKPTLSSIAISGASSLTSGQSATFTCEATYSDGSKKSVSPSWSIYSGSSYAAITSSGVVTAKSVSAQQAVTVKASYTEDGVTKTATWGFYVTIAAPSAPTGVSATQGTEPSCIRVSWTAPSGATEYSVFRAAVNNVNNAPYLDRVTVPRYNDTSATPGVDYWYFVKARNSSGTSGVSASANGWRKLSPPDSVTATDNLLDKVRVTWNSMEGASYYRVYRATSMDGLKSALGNWQTSTSFDDTTATAGVTYYYYVVAAVDASGSRPSDYSIVEDGKRAEPVTVSALAINGAASISSGGNATYTATATYTDDHTASVSPTWSITSGSSYADLSGNRITAAIVTANQTVTLRASYTESGKTVTGTKTITISAIAPTVPQNLSAAVSSSPQGVTLTWSAVTGAAEYAVYRDGGMVGRVIPNAPNATPAMTYTDSTATPGVSYTYTVSAVNGAGESARSSGVTAMVPLAAPSGVTATSDRTDGVAVSWSAVNGATHYRVARATSATGAKTELGSWQTGRTYTDTSATAGTAYWYFVRAATSSSGANASAYSSSAQGMRRIAVTLSSISISGVNKVAASKTAMYSCTASYSDGTTKTVSPTWSVSPSSAATIDAAGKLTAKAVSANATATITASFTDGVTKTATKSVTIVAPITATATISDVGVTSRWPFSPLLDIDYTLSVTPTTARAAIAVFGRDDDHGVDMAATSLTGDGANGSYIAAGRHRLTWDIRADYTNFHAKSFSVTLTATPSIIGVPEDVAASSSASVVALSWNAVDDAIGYEVWRGTGTTTNGASRIATVTSGTTYSDTTGAVGTTYRYWVRAYSDDGYGEFAQPVTGTREASANPLYCVIDLSGGASASSYPVTYMDSPPSGGFNTDEYKTSKLVLRRIEPGTIPTRDVTLTKAYYIGVFEVTQKQYELVMGTKPSYFNQTTCYATRPVENVSYNTIRGWSAGVEWPGSSAVDATSFMGKLREKTGIDGFDLPTEAQWEYACRAGTTTDYNSGKNNTGSTCTNMDEVGRYYYNGGQNYRQNCNTSAGTAKVGSYIPNAWGLYDMHGNVCEWCLDRDGSLLSGTDPIGSSSGSNRVLRGGDWNRSADYCSSSYRSSSAQEFGYSDVGFRLVRTLSDDVSADVHGKVQLWEGGPYWATTNIGAENPEDYGYYFWWGDTVGYRRADDAWVASDGSSSNFSFGPENTPTYNKDIAILQSEGWITSDGVLALAHDAAHVQWGGNWRIPTKQELTDLISNCDWTWTTKNDVNGYEVRGRGDYAPYSIFLPAAGFGTGPELSYDVFYGDYWSSDSCSENDYVWQLGFTSMGRNAQRGYREDGQSVRPVQGFSYVVTLDRQNGIGGTASVTATYGSAMPSITVPTRSGYTFGGYYAGGSQYYTASGASARAWNLTSATTLYAKWTAIASDGHVKVQLWEGGPYWATTNIGAENPEDYGYYFWWGDTIGYKCENNAWVASDGSSSNFQFYNDPISQQTYNKSIATLQSEGWIVPQGDTYVLAPTHDAAHVNWGGGWRVPTNQELTDLISNCDWTWTTKNGVNGYEVRGRGDYAPYSIFLPCAGFGTGTELAYDAWSGCYWSSVPNSENDYAWELDFFSSDYDAGNNVRYLGQSVRPVQGFTNVATYVVTLDRQSGSGGTASVTATYGSAMPSITVPTRSGYTFGGYYTSTNGSGTQYYTASGASARSWDKTSATTLYAKWTANADVHDKVQLWAGGPYWATTNIGAENPEDYGYYFWWGDTVGYRRENDAWVASDGSVSGFLFSEENTPTRNKDFGTLQSEGWITSDGVLVPAHDAAHVHWGGNWRMPTSDEIDALIANCTTTWIATNGVSGRLVKGKGDYADRSIFLPAAGDGYGSNLYDVGSHGFYWSSRPNSLSAIYPYRAWRLYFDSSDFGRSSNVRYLGQSVRPVQEFAQ